ncbi:hypothetical protein A4G19_00535 [Pasteurellaceae bacterium Macca]|nr:hypothetical protein [Pasteurellaceae bacterium Macca]
MEKRIFSQQAPTQADEVQGKKEFDSSRVEVVREVESIDPEPLDMPPLAKAPRWWVRVLLMLLVLLIVATVAQSVQWLVDAWQGRAWIDFAFGIVFAGVSLTAIGVIVNEWRKLVWLRKYHQNQQVSQDLWQNNASTSGQIAQTFCQQLIKQLPPTDKVSQSHQRWLSQLDEAYNSQEVLFLFSENVLKPIDSQVKKWISQSAVENAIIVAVSPLAVVDMLMVAWRNIALVNKITRAYGMELGYFSRLKLFKMVLTNLVFAGASEVVSDMGMDFFSQNLTARLSMRAAQGIGVGLLTARLGIKAMEFCRPVVFQGDERPKLSVVRQTLLTSVKQVILGKNSEKVHENA